jgi:hypothetical protein
VLTLGFPRTASGHFAHSTRRLFPAWSQGSFTFVDRTDLLDETLGSYLGDSTAVVAVDVCVRIEPAAGTTIVKVMGPGEVSSVEAGTGAVEVRMPSGPVAAVREILVQCTVTPVAGEAGGAAAAGAVAAQCAVFSVTATGMPPGAAAAAGADGAAPERLQAAPLAVALRLGAAAAGAAPADAPAADAIIAARNREAVAAAAAATAAALHNDDVDAATAAIATATASLAGTPAQRATAETELAALQQSSMQQQQPGGHRATSTPAYAYGLSDSLRLQSTYSHHTTSMTMRSKGASKGHSHIIDGEEGHPLGRACP